MSLETVLTHLDDARDALAAALTEKGLNVSADITLYECADFISVLPDVGSVDVSDTTATAADVLSGKDFYLADGTKATGTIQTVTASLSANVVTVPAGYIATSQTLTVPEAEAATVSANVVTIPVGYIASQRTVTVGTAVAAATITPTTSDQTIAAGSYLSGAQTILGDANLVSANIVSGVTIFGVTGTASGGGGTDVSDTTATASDVLAGKYFYTAAGVKTEGTITSLAAQTITPTTADQTLAAGNYLSGAQTIKGDANLIASNIVSGVSIFGVTGSASGGATNYYKCATVDTVNSTWTGYKAVLSGGVYSFESNVTSGLTYSVITPEVGGVYANGALIEANLYEGIPTQGLVFYAPLSASANAAETGQSFTITGSPVFASYLGIPAAYFSGLDVIEAANTNIPYSESPCSVSLWVNIASNPSENHGILSIGKDSEGALMAVVYNSTGIGLSGHGPGYGWDNEGAASVTFDGTWHHLAIVFGQGESGSRPTSLYLDGTLVKSGAFLYNDSAYGTYTPQLFLGSYWGNASYLPNFTGRMAAVRIYNRALSAAEIGDLADEFLPIN